MIADIFQKTASFRVKREIFSPVPFFSGLERGFINLSAREYKFMRGFPLDELADRAQIDHT